MTSTIYLEELGNGRVLVQLATGIAVVLRAVAELREGESYAEIPYSVWATHAGKS